MAAWLRMDLASTTSTWIIAFWHHPPYSKGTHDSDTEAQLIGMLGLFNPILEQGGVDLVLCGHSHNYERGFLLDGHYGSSDTLTAAMRKTQGMEACRVSPPSSSGITRRAPDFIATATSNGVVIPGDGAHLKPLTGPRDHFGAVYRTAGMSGEVYGYEAPAPPRDVRFLQSGRDGESGCERQHPQSHVCPIRRSHAGFFRVKVGR